MLSIIPATTFGVTRTPSLAIAEKTSVACMAVTEYPCPKDIVGAEESDQALTGCKIPIDSPGKFEPVLWPIPNFLK